MSKRTGAAVCGLAGIVLYASGVAWTAQLQPFPTEDVEIYSGLEGMWVRPVGGKKSPAPAVLIANGATGTLEHNLPLAIELAKHGVASLLFDFRGQGRSRGKFRPDEDLDVAIEYFRNHPGVDPGRLGVAGHSLGGRLLGSRMEPFRAGVIFGSRPVPDDPRILVAHSRFEFLFDPPEAQNLVIGPWSDHVTGPMDPFLLRHAVDWFGRHLGFPPTQPVTEGARIASRLTALFGGGLIVGALLMLVSQCPPTIVRNSFIPSIYLWITCLGTVTFPILLLRRTSPRLRMFRGARWRPLLLGTGFFLAAFILSLGFASWSYFNVMIYPWKLGFFGVTTLIFTLICWHDQNIVHGQRIEAETIGRRDLLRAAMAGVAGRWTAAAFLFLVAFAASGRTGSWMLLAGLSFLTFWLEALAASLTLRSRHPLAGGVFLGLTWGWLATVFLPG